MRKPTVAITMGDPAGVGPETVVGAWRLAEFHASCWPVAVGHDAVLRRAVERVGSPIRVVSVEHVDSLKPSADVMPCVQACSDGARDVAPAAIDPRGGQAAYEAVCRATELALSGQVDAITTAPLHKAALWQAGHHYPGHTELLAELSGVSDFAMMLYLGPSSEVRSPAGLSVVHATLHMALRDVPRALDTETILSKARLVHDAARRLGGRVPRIGICALNPHAGEGGLFGDEEQTIILPAVRQGCAEGLDLHGPYPADTLLSRARAGHFEAVVAMYHDQGHIAVKMLAMHRAVNVTLGLPIVRTSVAHGTAFDLAWQGKAEVSGMVEAVRVAGLLARQRMGRDLGRGASTSANPERPTASAQRSEHS